MKHEVWEVKKVLITTQTISGACDATKLLLTLIIIIRRPAVWARRKKCFKRKSKKQNLMRRFFGKVLQLLRYNYPYLLITSSNCSFQQTRKHFQFTRKSGKTFLVRFKQEARMKMLHCFSIFSFTSPFSSAFIPPTRSRFCVPTNSTKETF